MNCRACRKTIGLGELLKCSQCRAMYHYACLCITSAEYRENMQLWMRTWVCTTCNNITIRNKRDETPVRSHLQQQKPDENMDTSYIEESTPKTDHKTDVSAADPNMLSAELIINKMSEILDKKLEKMRLSVISDIKLEFNSSIETLKKEFTETTEFLSGQIQDTNAKILSVNNRLTQIENENTKLISDIAVLKNELPQNTEALKLKEIVDKLQLDLNEKDQLMLSNDVEITGIPEYEKESLLHLLKIIAIKIGMALEDHDIVYTARVGPKKREKQQESEEKQLSQHRPIIVRFARRIIRDEMLKNIRTRKNFTSESLDLPEHSYEQIYINERLTKTNRQLFAKARKAGKAATWRYVWTKDGRIFAKRTVSPSSKSYLIREESDIIRVFSPDGFNNKSS